MKFLKPTLLLVFVMIAFTSCEKLDELTEIDVNDTITETITIDVNGDTSISKSLTISVADPDVQDNIDKIQSVTVEKLTLEFLDVNSTNDLIFNGYLDISGNNGGISAVSIGDTNISAADADNTITDLTGAESLIKEIARSIKNNAEVDLTFDGTVSEEPVSFKIKIVADVKVTVDVL